MAVQKKSNVPVTFLAFLAIGLIVWGILYSDEEKKPEKKPKKQQIRRVQPRQNSADALIKSLNLGDGSLAAAKKVETSGMGKATKISGGGIKTSGKSSSKSSSKKSSSKSKPVRKKG